MQEFQRAIFRVVLVLFVLFVLPLAILGVLLAVAMEFMDEQGTRATRGFLVKKLRSYGLLPRGKRLRPAFPQRQY